jgi:hypothetical protein
MGRPVIARAACSMMAGRSRGKRIQEQTQMIASANGKPAAKAPTIIKVNAESKFTSGRTLSTDMLLAPPPIDQKAATATRLSNAYTGPPDTGQGEPNW